MKVLILGPYRATLDKFLVDSGDEIRFYSYPISRHHHILQETDFIVSYGYRHILGDDILTEFSHRAINLHISLLPWNKGADPNLWSFLEDTPKGVTIHELSNALDGGDIVMQKKVRFNSNETLATTYSILTTEIEQLFLSIWLSLRESGYVTQASPQLRKGTYHRSRDKNKYLYLLSRGWDTPVENLIGKALGS